MFRRVADRSVLPRMDLAAPRQRTMSRCQRRIVSGVTRSRSPWHRAFGITLSRVASSVRSASSGSGGAAAAAAVWRAGGAGSGSPRSSTSPHTRIASHAAARVIRRKTNRRHMIGDHHGRAAGRATLLVRAVDRILGTHRPQNRVLIDRRPYRFGVVFRAASVAACPGPGDSAARGQAPGAADARSAYC